MAEKTAATRTVSKASGFGQSVPMVDGKEKVTGKAQYAVDITMPGMLHGKVLRSPHAHARILSIDTSKAEKLPGVRAVVTHADTSGEIIGFSQYNDHYIFAKDEVRFVGDEVAAVAATSENIAKKALALIEVEYEVLDAVFTVEDALAEGAPLVHSENPGNIAHEISYARGDTDAAFAACDVVIEEEFSTSPAHPAYIEPQACVASYGTNGVMDIWANTQSPGGSIREKTAIVLGLPLGQVRIHQTFLGGGFGGKVWQHIIPATAVLAKKARLPVRMVYTRREDLANTPSRVPMKFRLKMGADKSGRILAKETLVVADNGAYSINAPIVIDTAATRIENLYRFENIRTTARLVYTNKIASGTFRGFGNPQGTFMVESMMDMLADKLGMDPGDIRKVNVVYPGYTSVHGWKITSCEVAQCIDKVKELSGWEEKRRTNRFGYGIGMSCVIHVNGNRSCFPAFDGSTAFISVDESGGASVMCGDGDIGQGASTIFAQIAAEEIGLPLSAVRVLRTDTEFGGFAFGAFASRITLNGGNAVRDAAKNVRMALLETAAEMRGGEVDEFSIVDGVVYDSTGWSASVSDVSLQYIYSHAGTHLRREGIFIPQDVVIADKVTKYGNISAAYSFACHVAEVEIDQDTGKVEVLNYYAVHDAGNVINPMLAEGQIEGGVAQGLGYALYEDYHFGPDGRMLNNSFLDYKLPTFKDVPNIVCGFAESEDPVGPMGAKGLGEPTIVPVAAAVGNAIANALGTRICHMPFGAEKVRGTVQKILKERGQP
ncbi:xanthine dehydrogenase family protein molybdopterin-binding subunit [Clostridia bacterium OttesenSCG-928-O13]|nr:xanthine dehydrogenase family protein molybdopterin-binding subunit [Clostridia bacterium OttesenSCG-928-O13]